jgi:hypothetical protein
MQRITPADIQTLTKQNGKPAVSIYMPTQGNDFADNRSYLKRLLSQARQELTQFTSYKEKHEALYPAYRLLHDRQWWRFTDAGVAIFSQKGNVYGYHLSRAPYEEIVVSDRFHLLPLIKHLNMRQSFYVLALSPKNSRLLHCDGEDIYELTVPGLPRSVTDMAVREDHALLHQEEHKSKPRLRNALMALREGGKRAIKRQHQDVMETEYLQSIWKATHRVLARRHEPLVLAGLQRVQALYRRIDNGSYLYTQGIAANPDRLQNFELRDKARLLLDEVFADQEVTQQSKFLRLSVARPDRIVYGMKGVLNSVYQGKVQTLFVAREARQWGRIKSRTVEMHSRYQGGDSDLLDLAASETVRRKGAVYTLEPSDLPSDAKIAAILRY